jgi:hypothetical protein
MAAVKAGPSVMERAIAAHALLVGVAVSFLGCCLAGQVLSRHNCFREFTRFYDWISPQTDYYPTLSQVRALARATVDPRKVVVVLGGNSIMQGSGHRKSHVWTRHLQTLLGSDFQVLNLALPACQPFEFGATAAEVLSRDFPRLLLITNISPGLNSTLLPEPDGTPRLRYFFWEAHRRGLLMDSAARDHWLREAEHKGRDESFREMQDQLRLDLRLHFRDLWNAVTCRCVSTVWNRLVAESWLRPRAAYPEWDGPLPEGELPPSTDGYFMAMLRRSWIESGRLFVPPLQPPDELVKGNLAGCLPDEFRGRTLVLINRVSPRYLKQLTADERRIYDGLYPAIVRAYAGAGVTVVPVGQDLSTRHYMDLMHPNEEGGRRLAEEVAPLVRDLARRNWADVGR